MKSISSHAARFLSGTLPGAAILAASLVLGGPAGAAPRKANDAAIDYLTAPFRQERILDWGNRPNWSPDGRRIVFTKDDLVDGPAYEIDVQTRKVRCVTCHLGDARFVTRIFYLPDASFLIEATPGMKGGGGGAGDALRTQLYWMPKGMGQPISLGTGAMGDIAIARKANADKSVNVAWSKPKGKGLELVWGKLANDGKTASLTEVEGLYDFQPGKPSPVSVPEAYEFIDDGRSVMFWTVEPTTLDSEMYKVDIASKAISKVHATPAHNETHTFADERFGLEESNSLSDPDGPYRGISGLSQAAVKIMLQMAGKPGAGELAAANSDKGFDLAVVTLDGKRRRQLTRLSTAGAQAHQSIVSPDGRHIAFAVKSALPAMAKTTGLYVGTFGK